MGGCFSLEVVDLNIQAPNRNKRESKYYWDELYGLVSAGGFDTIEIPYEPKWDFGGRSGIPRTLRSINIKFGSVKGYLEHLAENGINGVECVHMDPTLFCSGAVEMYLGAFGHFAEEAIGFAQEAGANAVTFTVTPPKFAINTLAMDAQDRDAAFLEKTAGLIEMLAKTANEAGLKLCLKNEYWGLLAGDKIVDFVKGLKEKVYLDVDTANLKISGVDIVNFIEENKEMIGVVHFTDTAYVLDEEEAAAALPEHPMKAATKVYRDIGDGMVDFVAISKALKAANYEGPVVYNCKNSYDVCRSILRTRRYINKNPEV